MDKKNLFSQEALDKLKTPEKLDTLLHVTDSLSWMAVISIMLLLIGVVIWSVMGSFTVKAEGMGMVMDSGGIVAVTHTGGGSISELKVSPGEKIKEGEIVATIQGNTEGGVFSAYSGIVEEVPVRTGNVINAGAIICTVRLTDKSNELSGVFYVPVSESKKIQPGMTIQLSPSGVDVQSSGSLIGIVRNVSNYPVNTATIQRTLVNDEIPQMINHTYNSAVAEVRFDLVKDDKDESGYLWTSVVGKHEKITPGTFVSGFIVIDRQPPIEKVFYKFSQWLRNR